LLEVIFYIPIFVPRVYFKDVSVICNGRIH